MLHVGVHYSVVCSASSCVEANNVSDYNIKDYPLSNLHTNGAEDVALLERLTSVFE